MTDDQIREGLTALAGGAGGMVGGGVATIPAKLERKITLTTVIFAIAIGAFSPGVASRFTDMGWQESGLLGTVLGAMVLGILAGLKSLGQYFAKNPRRAIGDLISGRPPEPEKEEKS